MTCTGIVIGIKTSPDRAADLCIGRCIDRGTGNRIGVHTGSTGIPALPQAVRNGRNKKNARQEIPERAFHSASYITGIIRFA